MRAPRKFYFVVSRKFKSDKTVHEVVYRKYNDATWSAKKANERKARGVDDWRVETYVKGD